MTTASAAPYSLDGYHLLRLLGRGGFGEVWLAQSGALGDHHALKFITSDDHDLLERELAALVRYRQTTSLLRSLYLWPVEHINRYESGLFYVMPLADGLPVDGSVPNINDTLWVPLTLSAKIQKRVSEPRWFTLEQVVAMMTPVLKGLQQLSEAGLVHRDVKPDNILFFQGQPCLGDISLLDQDKEVITRRGTPGYLSPSWYIGGHTDMYAAAATLYTLLTGNAPDKMGRESFLWPPHGRESLTSDEQEQWRQMHAIIRRATDEHPSERYFDFHTMAEALQAVAHSQEAATSEQQSPNRTSYPSGSNTAESPASASIFQGETVALVKQAMAKRSRERMLKFGQTFLLWPTDKPGYWLNLSMAMIGLLFALCLGAGKPMIYGAILGISTGIRAILGANGIQWRKNLVYGILFLYVLIGWMQVQFTWVGEKDNRKPSAEEPASIRSTIQTKPQTSATHLDSWSSSSASNSAAYLSLLSV